MEILKKTVYNAKSGTIKEQSSINKLAYNHAAEYQQHGHDKKFNWKKKQDDDFQESYFIAPAGTDYKDSLEMFQHLEQIEDSRMKAQLAFNCILSLDHKLDYETNKKVLNEFVSELFTSQNIACDIAIHNKNNENLHAHLLAPTRSINEQGKLEKKVNSYKQEHFNTNRLRKVLAAKFNEERAKRGITEKIDYRSNEEKKEEALNNDDLVTAEKFNYKTDNEKRGPSRSKRYRKKRIELSKQRKAEAQQRAEQTKQQIKALKDNISQINQIEQNKKDIIQAAQDIQAEHDENQQILQNALNQKQLVEQHRKHELNNQFTFTYKPRF
ncbi:hypothetical protein A1D22_10890 [Pasteurellaceae bacterium LFhippo2]|nr:hypothetical protein [Pasteurellaceae bacterium LFhippo2]